MKIPVVRFIVSLCMTFVLLLGTCMPVEAQHSTSPSNDAPKKCTMCKPVPTAASNSPYDPARLSEAVMKAAIADLVNLRNRAQSNSLRVEDVQAAITSSQILQDHLDEIGYYRAVDEALLTNKEKILDYSPTENDVATVQKHLADRGATFSLDEARNMLNATREQKQSVFDIVALQGSRAFQAQFIQQLTKLKGKLQTQLRSGGTISVKFKRAGCCNNPCTVAHAVAASFGVACLFGCAPCCGAAAVAELEAVACDLATED